tara:strand:- start:3967 stop:4509 length:543 start_codon:yes stop_codon:yes gene_type:complete
MTSKYEYIQNMYNKIKNYRVDEDLLPTQLQLDKYIERLMGSQAMFMGDDVCYKRPFYTSPKGFIIGYVHTIIMFIDGGITIVMTNNMIERIPILRSIIIDGNGSDKPLRLKSSYDQQIIDGPLFYITKLPLNSLLFDTPGKDYDVKRYNSANYGIPDATLEKYFMFDNVEEALINYKWYA